MRLFLAIFFLCITFIAPAQNESLKKRELYFGVNLTRLIVQDYELQVIRRIDNKHMLGISAGYDFNGGEELFTDTKAATDTAGWHAYYTGTSEGETNQASRYFFGKGPAFRISGDFLSANKKGTVTVGTIELLVKIRNYDNYLYQKDEMVFLESATQQIYGLNVMGGSYTKIANFLLLKIFFGFGFRYLHSDVIRPGYYNYDHTYWHPEERFTYNLAFPWIPFGVSLFINTAGTGKPTIEK